MFNTKLDEQEINFIAEIEEAGNEELKEQEMDLRKNLKDSVMVLSQIKDSPGMKGLNLNPLSSEERKAISDLIGDYGV
ncbi:hypothetical protein QYM36_008834 [Artemia franciscana]|uniref:Uncharacterized protein n=1 Tax=Artemia franciscana TaxID=6661 RepID=A0AA88L2T4_ARTSF|nr:hypothetical protein QYM36_008834 [Artemia franciscana]